MGEIEKMKQVMQNYKTGELKVEEVPNPVLRPGGVLVRNAYSLISVGTEKTKVNLAQKSILGKAKARPDQVKLVVNNIKQEGLISTFKKAMNKLDTPISLGYSSAGVVLSVGEGSEEFEIGDRVACIGEGYASHSEVIFVPKNMCVKVTREVTLEQAAFTGIGAIALQGVRQAHLTLGERVAVIGLGLLGQLTVQILKANGCSVFAVDLEKDKVRLSKELGADIGAVSGKDDVEKLIEGFSQGYGVDAVIITAATLSNEPIELAGRISREKGRVVVVGAVKLDIPRKNYFEKEISLVISRAFGPGRYDKMFEEKGIDYPFGYVRWTARRNMEEFLELLKGGKVNVDKIMTHRFSIDEAPEAYEMIKANKKDFLGILFKYEGDKELSSRINLVEKKGREAKGVINIGFIGAGSFAQGYLLPNFKKIPGINFKGVATATGISSQSVARKFHFQYCTSDSSDILNDEEIHCVVIATRHNLHAKLAIEALRKNKVVFVEKPLALSEEELKEIIRTWTETQGRLMVGFNRRFSPFSQRAKEFFGNRTGPLVINYRVSAGPLPPDHWLHDPREGGGRIIGEVCHFVDLIQYLAGSDLVSVYAETAGRYNENIPPEDNVHIIAKLSDGSIGNISYSAIGDLSFPRERFEIFGEESVAVVDNFRKAIFVRKGKKSKMKKIGRDMGHKGEVMAFIEAVKAGSKMPIDFKEIVSTTLATFKIVDSIRKREPIMISLSDIVE